MSEKPRVAIVGGGLAGLAAAAALSDLALRVDLFEAKRRTGGRAGSFSDPASDQEVDYCQHVAMGCCTNFLHLMRRSGLISSFRCTRSLEFRGEGVSPSRFAAANWLPAPLHLVPSFTRLAFLDRKEKASVRRALWRLMRSGATTLERDPTESVTAADAKSQTMGEWLRAHGQSDRVIRRFWNVVLASALGDDVQRVAFEPARKVFVDGFLSERHATDLWIPQQPLSELFGRRLPASLGAAGVSLHEGARIRACESTADDLLRLRSGRTDEIAAATYEAVILAVPWNAIGRLVADGPLAEAIPWAKDLATIPTAPISGIHLWLDRPLTQAPHTVIVDRLSQWVFRHPLANDAADALADSAISDAGHYYQVVVSAAHDLRSRDGESVITEVMEDLRAVFPEAGGVRCLRSRIVTDPSAVFSVTPAVERRRPTVTTGHPRLFVAGDYVRTGWPATMEGAVISGYQAAAQVARAFGYNETSLQPPLARGPLARWLIASDP